MSEIELQTIYSSLPSSDFVLAALQRGAGNYVNWIKLVPVILIYLFWVGTTNWVERDMEMLRGANEVWKVVVFLVGLVGLAVAFLTPLYLIQLPVLVLAWFLPLLFYINYRNTKVPEDKHVTVGSIFTAGLGKIGIHGSDGDDEESLEGPPVKLIARLMGEKNQNMALVEGVQEHEMLVPTKELLFDAVNRRATDILMEARKDRVLIRYKIDGVAMAAEPFDRPTGKGVLEILKTVAQMNPAERRKPQKGSFAIDVEGKEIEIRIASQGTTTGERITMRLLDSSTRLEKVQQLGMSDQMMDELKEVLGGSKGLVLVTGAPGTGKTTTLYAVLRSIDRFMRNVSSFEDVSDYKVDNVNHLEFSKTPDTPVTAQFVSLLRQVPDVVGIADIRDKEIADLACLNANQDKVLIGVFPGEDATTGLLKFLNMGVERDDACDAIVGVLSQKLVRRLCDACKEPYKPKGEFLKKANIPASKVDFFYRPPRAPEEPCTICGDVGYKGRTGVFEFLVINDKIRTLLKETAPANAIKAEARKNGMAYLQDDGLRQVIHGVTSIDEVMKAFKKDSK